MQSIENALENETTTNQNKNKHTLIYVVVVLSKNSIKPLLLENYPTGKKRTVLAIA